MSADPDNEQELEADKHTVAALRAAGDPLTKPRPVEHWIYFETAEGRQAFVDEARLLGFAVEFTDDEAAPPLAFGACLSRVDRVDLDSIHRVVMTLVGMAKRHAGDYDGWESPVEAE